MPATKKTAATAIAATPLHKQVIDGTGLDVHERPNGTVLTLRHERKVIGEICVGARATRLNLKSKPKAAPKGLALGGQSKSWACGVILTADNVAAVRALLAAAVKTAA
jgi:hypothetical protein